MVKYWKNKAKNSRVIKTTHKPKKGFYSFLGGTVEGYRKMNEGLVEKNYEECTQEYYDKFIEVTTENLHGKDRQQHIRA